MNHFCVKLYLFVFVLCAPFVGHTQEIGTQQQFDYAMDQARRGKALSIKLLPGSYHLSKPVKTKAPVSIIGIDAAITAYTDTYSCNDSVKETSSHYICRLKTPIDEFSLMIDQDGKLVDVSESVEARTLVNKVSSIAVIHEDNIGLDVRIPIPDNLSELRSRSFQKAFGYFDCGWARINFKLKESDNQYLYCETLHKTNVSNVDYEKSHYKNDIRFVIYNAEVKANAVFFDNEFIYIPKNVQLLKVKRCNVFSDSNPDMLFEGDVKITGVTFDGINGVRIKSGLCNCCDVIGCKFTHTLGDALIISKNSDGEFRPAHVSQCIFEECSVLWNRMLDLSSSFVGKKCIFVNDCKFVRYPDAKVRYKNTSAMVRVNADASISNCFFSNTCRCHLSFIKGSSNSEGNVIINTSEFNSAVERNLSNDWGLIYIGYVYSDNQQSIANKKHKVVLDGCFLSGAYSNAGDARGIMIDDGRGDVICRNNIILDTQSYSIDSREVKSLVGTSSIRNKIVNNILGNRYRLAGGVDVPYKDRPITKDNILLGEYNNVFNDNSSVEGSDMVIPINYEAKEGKMYVSKSEYERIRKVPFYHKVEQYIRIKKD